MNRSTFPVTHHCTRERRESTPCPPLPHNDSPDTINWWWQRCIWCCCCCCERVLRQSHPPGAQATDRYGCVGVGVARAWQWLMIFMESNEVRVGDENCHSFGGRDWRRFGGRAVVTLYCTVLHSQPSPAIVSEFRKLKTLFQSWVSIQSPDRVPKFHSQC